MLSDLLNYVFSHSYFNLFAPAFEDAGDAKNTS
jgi:hypothetical protein